MLAFTSDFLLLQILNFLFFRGSDTFLPQCWSKDLSGIPHTSTRSCSSSTSVRKCNCCPQWAPATTWARTGVPTSDRRRWRVCRKFRYTVNHTFAGNLNLELDTDIAWDMPEHGVGDALCLSRVNIFTSRTEDAASEVNCDKNRESAGHEALEIPEAWTVTSWPLSFETFVGA